VPKMCLQNVACDSWSSSLDGVHQSPMFSVPTPASGAGPKEREVVTLDRGPQTSYQLKCSTACRWGIEFLVKCPVAAYPLVSLPSAPLPPH
jgi:hypothetical protein